MKTKADRRPKVGHRFFRAGVSRGADVEVALSELANFTGRLIHVCSQSLLAQIT